MRCLVTVVNKNRVRNRTRDTKLPYTYLFQVDLLTKEIKPVSLPKELEKYSQKAFGMTGMCKKGENYLISFQGSEYPPILELDKNLQFIKTHQTKLTRSTHNIAMINDSILLMISTGTDSIISHDMETGEESVYYPQKNTEDRNHMNGLLFHDEKVYYSAFGPKAGKLWKTAEKGFLRNLTEDTILETPIYQPHTIFPADDTLYFCESARALVRNLKGEKLDVGLGYTRGLIVTDQYIAVGLSTGRIVSQSTGVILESSHPGEARGDCGIALFEKDQNDIANSKFLHLISLDEFAEEVYDLLLI